MMGGTIPRRDVPHPHPDPPPSRGRERDAVGSKKQPSPLVGEGWEGGGA